VRSTFVFGTMILVLAFCCGAAAENESEESASAQYPPPAPAKGRRAIAPPRPAKEGKASRRPTVPLELPEEIEEETAGGLSLDDALRRLRIANRELAIKYRDIPKARADTLSAGLIENPAVFLDSDGIPYGNYSPQRPGATSYGATVVFPPLDVSGKRRKRIIAARRAEKVLEALYQDAVRQEIDKLYSAYVDVLEAALKRSALRQAAARMRAVKTGDDDAVRRAYSEIALREADANLIQARRELALLLAVAPEQADDLPVRGSLRDRAPPPPATDELIRLALQTRPDLAAFRLSVDRARANVQLSRAEVWDDVLTFYTPAQIITFPSQGAKTATAWEAGGLAVLPIFERNQGDIVRARANVTQLQLQVRGLSDQVINEVQRAVSEYTLSRQLVQKYEDTILPNARRLRDDKQRRFSQGQETADALLAAEQNSDEALQRYLETLVNHRRSMLRLNTVVGQRILP
jgi:cobalt-zinc-cadmium efflux system outer membrane protein